MEEPVAPQTRAKAGNKRKIDLKSEIQEILEDWDDDVPLVPKKTEADTKNFYDCKKSKLSKHVYLSPPSSPQSTASMSSVEPSLSTRLPKPQSDDLIPGDLETNACDKRREHGRVANGRLSRARSRPSSPTISSTRIATPQSPTKDSKQDISNLINYLLQQDQNGHIKQPDVLKSWFVPCQSIKQSLARCKRFDIKANDAKPVSLDDFRSDLSEVMRKFDKLGHKYFEEIVATNSTCTSRQLLCTHQMKRFKPDHGWIQIILTDINSDNGFVRLDSQEFVIQDSSEEDNTTKDPDWSTFKVKDSKKNKKKQIV